MAKIFWRSRDARVSNMNQTKIIQHDVFLKRIQKSLYCSAARDDITEMPSVSKPFADYAAEVFSEPHRGYSLNRLQSVMISRLKANPCALILAMIYLERLQDTDPMYTKQITPTELFLVSMMISTKFYCGYDEETMYANEWAEQGNLTLERIKQLELEFLSAVNWNIYVSNQIFFEKLKYIEILLAKRQGLQRGWLTYTELANLIPSMAIAKSFLQFNALFAVSYAASVVTIAGAFFLASQVPGTALYNSTKSTTLPKTIDAENQSKLPNLSSVVVDTSLKSQNKNEFIKLAEPSLNCLDEQFQRLHGEYIRDEEIPSANIPLLINRSIIPSSTVVVSVPQINLRQNFGIHFGINLRNYLDSEEDEGMDTISPNLSSDSNDFIIQFKNYDSDWYRNKYNLLRFWMMSWA